MKMTSLKLSKKEAKTEYGMDTVAPGKASDENLPQFPYRTKIRLETEALDKLGIRPSEYEVGQVLEVTCRVEVCGVTEEKLQNGKERCELELQITDISLGPDKKAKKDKAEGDHVANLSEATSDKY